jgi:hypothetical protein
MFKMSQTLEEALQIATAVYEAEIQEKRNEMFYTGVVKKCEKYNRYGHASQQVVLKCSLVTMNTGLRTLREVTGGKIKIKAMQIGVRTCI